MLNTLRMILNLRVSSLTNMLIYYLQRLPWLGRRISNRIYGNLRIKRIAAVFAFCLSLLWGFLAHSLYVGLVIFFPVRAAGGHLSTPEQLALFWHIFFLLSFIIAGVANIKMLEPKRDKYIAVKLMRLPATRYMQATLGYRYAAFLVFLLPALLFFSARLGASPLTGVIVAIATTLWRLVCELLHLWIFRQTGTILIKHNLIVWLVILGGLAAAYAPLQLGWIPATGMLLINGPVMFLIAALGLTAGIRLFRFTRYEDAVEAATKRDDPLLDLGKVMADAQKSTVQTKESDYTAETLSSKAFEGKKGFSYLNAIFFVRHRSLIYEPVKKRLAVLGGLGAAALLAVFVFRQQAASVAAGLGHLLPILLIVQYFLSVGERICKALFYHCDLKLLRHSFYRQAAAEHFRLRLARILGLNLLIAGILGLILTIVASVAGDFSVIRSSLILMWICVLSLSVFFSVHHLFSYYIFQPYTTELNAKNPFFLIFNWAISMVSVITIQMRPDPLYFTIAVLALSVLYLGCAFALVPKYAPRTFRVK